MWPFTRKKKVVEPEPVPEPEVPPAPPETELEKLQREVFERVVSGKPGPVGIDDWRLQIYAGMYESRTQDALIEDVPHTAKLLGGEFPGLVKRYVADLPSTHYSLAQLGHGFAQWLREHPVLQQPEPAPAPVAESVAVSEPAPASEPVSVPVPVPVPEPVAVPVPVPEPVHVHVHAAAPSEHATRSDLADLATLEWARSESFIADNFTPIDPETVQQVGPERFTRSWMQFVPSLRLLELSHRVTELWKALEAGDPLTPALSPKGEREFVVVWRKGFEVFHVAIAEDEYQAMRAAQSRETVAQICERFASRGDDAAHAAFQALGSWLNEGMVAALREPPQQDTFGI